MIWLSGRYCSRAFFRRRQLDVRDDLRAHAALTDERREQLFDARGDSALPCCERSRAAFRARRTSSPPSGADSKRPFLIDDRHSIRFELGNARRDEIADRGDLFGFEPAARLQLQEHRCARRATIANGTPDWRGSAR